MLEGRSVQETGFPEELGLNRETDSPGKEINQQSRSTPLSFRLPVHIDQTIFSDFLSRQNSVLEDMENAILEVEKSGGCEKSNALRRILHNAQGRNGIV